MNDITNDIRGENRTTAHTEFRWWYCVL